ncbi:signal recognition particle protein Srp54 [Nanoarchaeota archaeon]
MVLDKLGQSLRDTLKKITKATFVDEKLVNELVKDIQRALLQSDVNVQLVFKLTQAIKERAMKEDVASISKKEHLVNIVYEELVTFLGGTGAKIEFTKKPFKIMLVGLFGNGKTTTAGKIAYYYGKRGKKVAVIQTDTWRPAAYDQLQQLAKKADAAFFGEKGAKDPSKIWKKYEKELKKYDLVIIDTAGRDALNDELIEELNKLNKEVKPDESLLVIAADIGQGAEQQAEAFHKTCKVTGVTITKLDGTAKGGGALIACSVTGAPIKFIGVGEKIDNIEEFRPEGFVGRLLGMGDLEALLEKAKEAISEEQAEDLGRRFLKGEFNLIDLYEQMKAMQSMGPLSKVIEMVPGMSQMSIPKEALEGQQEKMGNWRVLMDSMTKEELEDPSVITSSRIERISKGAGLPASDVRSLLKQYAQAKKMAKMLKGGNEKQMKKLMKKMQQQGRL